MNTTSSDLLMTSNIDDYYVVCSLSTFLAFIAVIICTMILLLVWRTKSRLHTVSYLLMCNTCFASSLYCVAIVNNYGFLIFDQWQTSDMSCRWRAYFAYSGIAAIMYSYLIQAISRFFFSVLSIKYRWLISFKTHYILILSQWIIIFLLTSPSLITQDIHFYPEVLCWVSMQYPLHLAYTIFAYYIIPVTTIVIIYIYIYYRVKQRTNNIITTSRINHQKRDLKLLRNILVLLSIYLGSGLPTILFCLTSIKLIYLINLVCLTLAVVIEKLFAIILNRELRQVFKSILCRTRRISPFNNVQLVERQIATIQ
jgi:hypothetical protein